MADKRTGGILQSPDRKFAIIHYVWIAALLFLTPLIGIVYLGLPPGPYLEFPPPTKHVAHARFSWPVFLVLLSFITAACAPFLSRLVTYKATGERAEKRYPFPWWGRLGIVVVLVSWILAWNRFSFFESLQQYTFTPLWLGYILTVNGLTCRRKGSCLLVSRPHFFLALFAASALFWWYFEYLNRFVRNWYYIAGGDISPVEYVIHASICFSTVLPAVLSTYELLRTIPRLEDAYTGWRPVSLPGRKGVGLLLVAGPAASLACLAVYPDYLFPLVWISPLLVIIGVRILTGAPNIFAGIQKGNWHPVILSALAALICGFFWELWNWKSLAHWEYSVPYVDRFRIFAMPLLGYAGYLPFGPECYAAAALLTKEPPVTKIL